MITFWFSMAWMPTTMGSIYTELLNGSISDKSSSFGPGIPTNGLRGTLVDAESQDSLYGCSLLSLEPGSVALVMRGKCSFTEKVRLMQNSGALAVIVGNNVDHQKLMHMFATEPTSDIVIPSVFISKEDFKRLQDMAHQKPRLRIFMTRNPFDTPFVHVIMVGFVGPALVLATFYALCAVRQTWIVYRKANQCQWALSNIPVKSYNLERDGSDKHCAICLEDYVDEEMLRVLPCHHDFHKRCLDRILAMKIKVDEQVFEDQDPELEQSDSDDESPEAVSNIAQKEAELERAKALKELNQRKKAALKAKRRQINEQLVQQSSLRKAKTIEKAHLLPTELLEAAKDLDWNESQEKEKTGKHTKLDQEPVHRKRKQPRKEHTVGNFKIIALNKKTKRSASEAVMAFKTKATLNPRVKRTDVLTNLDRNKRRQGPAPFFT